MCLALAPQAHHHLDVAPVPATLVLLVIAPALGAPVLPVQLMFAPALEAPAAELVGTQFVVS